MAETPVYEAHTELAAPAPPPDAHTPATSVEITPVTWKGRIASISVMVLVLLFLVGGLAISGVIPHSWFVTEKEQGTTTLPDALPVSLVKDRPRTLLVPKEVRTALGMRKGGKDIVAVVEPPRAGTPLVLSGSTALDPTRILRIRARFAPAEVISLGQTRDVNDRDGGSSRFRELRTGDIVKKGTILGEFSSVDVGSRKNDLYDALVQLKLDEEILDRAIDARGSISEVFILNASRDVLRDRNNISRAEYNLRTWSIPPEDIQAIRDEAAEANLDSIKKRQNPKDEDKDKAKERREKEKKAKEEQVKRWARVELKAPFDAKIIERNVAQHEVVVDGNTNLFVLSRLDANQMAVIANAPEDDLPLLEGLKFSQRHWTVRTVGLPPEGVEGSIDEIGAIIDANQHTAVVKGHIPNPKGLLRGGTFATFTIQLPPPPDTVEVPIDAIVDDGKQSVVFVQADPSKNDYTMRRILLTQRFEKTAFVRSKLRPEDRLLKPGEKELGVLVPEPLRPGERVILAGVLELKKELEDKESESAKR